MNHNAKTILEAKEYYQEINKILASIRITPINEMNYENKALIIDYSNGYSSIYILDGYRGYGLFKNILSKINKPIMTMDECDIVNYLIKNNIEHIIIEPSSAYKLISNYYGDKTAKRSGLRLMNHIDEGLVILNEINAKQEVLDAYCLHPMLQSDDAFRENLYLDFGDIPSYVLLLAMEYRRVANSYLSTMDVSSFVGFTNNEIKQMLFADKKQNEKDFAIYHEGTHKRSIQLRLYFDRWLNTLLK